MLRTWGRVMCRCSFITCCSPLQEHFTLHSLHFSGVMSQQHKLYALIWCLNVFDTAGIVVLSPIQWLHLSFCWTCDKPGGFSCLLWDLWCLNLNQVQSFRAPMYSTVYKWEDFGSIRAVLLAAVSNYTAAWRRRLTARRSDSKLPIGVVCSL